MWLHKIKCLLKAKLDQVAIAEDLSREVESVRSVVLSDCIGEIKKMTTLEIVGSKLSQKAKELK